MANPVKAHNLLVRGCYSETRHLMQSRVFPHMSPSAPPRSRHSHRDISDHEHAIKQIAWKAADVFNDASH